jgi:hypothetical protein
MNVETEILQATHRKNTAEAKIFDEEVPDGPNG